MSNGSRKNDDAEERTSGWKVDATESPVPFILSPICSVVDFSESGWTDRAGVSTRHGKVKRSETRTFKAAPALSVRD